MSILLLGVDHRHAPLDVLERLAVPSDDTRKVCRELADLDHVLEAAVISTCNRMEVIVDLARFHDGYEVVAHWLAERAHMPRTELDPMLIGLVDEDAARHLFAVASGLDSMVFGEQQILMQVRDAMEEAREEGTIGRMLQRMLRQSVRVGRRVRRETGVSDGASSMVDVGLEAALRMCPETGLSLATLRTLVIGAGEVGALTVQRLDQAGATGVRVHNRSMEKAQRLAAKVGGAVVGPDGLVDALAEVDLVVCTSGAPKPVVTHDLVAEAVDARGGHPLVLLDLAVPRNVSPEVNEIDGAHVLDVAAVRDAANRTVAREVLADAEALIAEEAAAFRQWLRQIEVEPTIRALRERAEQVRSDELGRLSSRLSGLDEAQLQTVEALTEGIINTLLHEPTVRLKRLADSGAAHHAEALVELFGLDATQPDELGAEETPHADGGGQ